jgi:hypothetical protein
VRSWQPEPLSDIDDYDARGPTLSGSVCLATEVVMNFEGAGVLLALGGSSSFQFDANADEAGSGTASLGCAGSMTRGVG